MIRETTAKSRDGRIDQSDFLNYSNATTRYSLFTPMEASIIFHFAGRGSDKRLALVDFAQLLNPRWRPPSKQFEPVVTEKSTTAVALNEVFQSAYNFVLGGRQVVSEI
jgi:solute carrier family 25 (mitochondrial aspartate/glutamate transporter), member 12/13